jgi:GDPmannose 4,6-dehydratase
MFISCGISYNHESERRSEEFVSRKITRAVAQMKKELIETGEIKSKLVLGNLDAQRDFGYAPDYVKGFWQMLQQDIPDDYVLATGVTNSIRAFVETAFKLIGVVDWNKYVKISDEFKRPTEVDFLMGDATKAREKLNWMPTIGFEEMIKKMIEAD